MTDPLKAVTPPAFDACQLIRDHIAELEIEADEKRRMAMERGDIGAGEQFERHAQLVVALRVALTWDVDRRRMAALRELFYFHYEELVDGVNGDAVLIGNIRDEGGDEGLAFRFTDRRGDVLSTVDSLDYLADLVRDCLRRLPRYDDDDAAIQKLKSKRLLRWFDARTDEARALLDKEWGIPPLDAEEVVR